MHNSARPKKIEAAAPRRKQTHRNQSRVGLDIAPIFREIEIKMCGKSGDELSATYRFKISDGMLLWRVNNLGWEPLDPTVQDEFIPGVRQNHDNRIITFSRNEQHQVVGLTVALWRMKGVSFTKARNRTPQPVP